MATCRLVFVGSTVQFSRLAVKRSARRQGIAAAAAAATDDESRARGADRHRAARPDLRAAALRPGRILPRGREFVEADIEHIAMEKLL